MCSPFLSPFEENLIPVRVLLAWAPADQLELSPLTMLPYVGGHGKRTAMELQVPNNSRDF